MGIEEIIAEINEKAKSDSEAILKEGRAQAQEILKNAEKEVKERKSAADADVENVKGASEKRELAAAELSCKKLVQDAKRELIDAAYAGLKKKISAMNERERAKMLGQLFERSNAEIGRIGTIYVSGADIKLAEALFRAKKVAVKERDILGGLVAESSGGRMSVDYSFESMIDSMKDRVIKDISRLLF